MATILSNKFGELEFSAVESIDVTYPSMVSTRPIEAGSEVSDNISNKSAVINLVAWVSNSTSEPVPGYPIVDDLRTRQAVPKVVSQIFDFVTNVKQKDPVKFKVTTPESYQGDNTSNAKSFLLTTRSSREPVTLIRRGTVQQRDQEEDFENLVITKLNFSKNANISGAIKVTLTLTEARKVAFISTVVPAQQPSESVEKQVDGKTEIGNKQTISRSEAAARLDDIIFKNGVQ